MEENTDRNHYKTRIIIIISFELYAIYYTFPIVKEHPASECKRRGGNNHHGAEDVRNCSLFGARHDHNLLYNSLDPDLSKAIQKNICKYPP